MKAVDKYLVLRVLKLKSQHIAHRRLFSPELNALSNIKGSKASHYPATKKWNETYLEQLLHSTFKNS